MRHFHSAPDSPRRQSSLLWAGYGLMAILLGGLIYGSLATIFYDYNFDAANAAIASGQAESAKGYLTTAIRMRPDLADPYRILAEQTSFADPTSAIQLATKAVGLDPNNWRNWSTLGLLYFQTDKLARARSIFLKGLRFDHGFAAHFQMGNLALLLGQEPIFWTEMNAALRVVPPGHVQDVLQEVQRQTDLNSIHFRQVFNGIPSATILASVEYYLDQQKPGPASVLWQTVQCSPDLRKYCGQVVAHIALETEKVVFDTADHPSPEVLSNLEQAIRLWNKAVQDGYLNQDPVSPDHCQDGKFQHSWQGPAFSWAPDAVVPAELTPQAGPEKGNAVTFNFSGNQPENVELLAQVDRLLPDQIYTASYQARLMAPSPLQGVVLRISTPTTTILDLPVSLETGWVSASAIFKVPPGTDLVRIAFAYQRPTGQMLLDVPVQVANLNVHKL